MIQCYNCGIDYNPIPYRWRCPACGTKDTCCDGEPQPLDN